MSRRNSCLTNGEYSCHQVYFFIGIEHLNTIAQQKFCLKPSIKGFSPSLPQESIPFNDGRSRARLSADFEYVFQSLLWCMRTGSIKTGGFAVSLGISDKFCKLWLLRKWDRGINSKYSKLYGIGTKQLELW